jgi:hypothetical protein
MDRHDARGWVLWPLPLVAGLAPALAALTALWLSFALDIIPACNPLLDGCVSISRAARHDLPNHVFRAVVLPSAVLQALTWVLCASWLREAGSDARATLRVLPWLGVGVGLGLVIYGTFLGTDGQVYRWLRRYGVIFYFGISYLNMLLVSRALWRLARAGALRPPARLDLWLIVLCAVTLAVALAEVFAPPLINDEDLKDRLENLLEWYVALALTLFFVALSWLWRSARLLPRWDGGR